MSLSRILTCSTPACAPILLTQLIALPASPTYRPTQPSHLPILSPLPTSPSYRPSPPPHPIALPSPTSPAYRPLTLVALPPPSRPVDSPIVSSACRGWSRAGWPGRSVAGPARQTRTRRRSACAGPARRHPSSRCEASTSGSCSNWRRHRRRGREGLSDFGEAILKGSCLISQLY